MSDETPTNEQGIPLEALKTEVIFKEVEVSRLNLKQNDVLVVKMHGDDFDVAMLKGLQAHFRKVFPNNKVLVFSLIGDMEMDLEIVRAALVMEPQTAYAPTPASPCATAPKGYCEGCDCGKKDAAEAEVEKAKPGPQRMTKGQLVKVIEAGHAVEGETGSIDSYIGGEFYLVRFASVGIIKMHGLALQETK